MSTDPKIYTATEVASVGLTREEIDEALVTITQKAYEAAKDGGTQAVHNSTNPNFLNELARRLRKLGYTTEVIEREIGDYCIIIHWFTY